jgi:hypothetical protein
MRCKLEASGLPSKNVRNHLKMQGFMDATADGSECRCDNLPHREQFIEQSSPVQPILARQLNENRGPAAPSERCELVRVSLFGRQRENGNLPTPWNFVAA